MNTRTSAAKKGRFYANEDDLATGKLIKCHYYTIVIDNGVRTLPAYCLKDSKIECLVLPPSVTNIGIGALAGSTVRKVLIRKPGNDSYDVRYDGLRRISPRAFQDCEQLSVFESH